MEYLDFIRQFWLTGTFWVTLSVLTFVALFGRKLWKNLTKLLDAKTAQIQQEFNQAEGLRKEAEKMLAEARKQYEDTKIEAADILEKARQSAEAIAAHITEEAKSSALRQQQAVAERIAATEKAVLSEIRTLASDIVIRATTDILEKDFQSEDRKHLIDHSLDMMAADIKAYENTKAVKIQNLTRS